MTKANVVGSDHFSSAPDETQGRLHPGQMLHHLTLLRFGKYPLLRQVVLPCIFSVMSLFRCLRANCALPWRSCSPKSSPEVLRQACRSTGGRHSGQLHKRLGHISPTALQLWCLLHHPLTFSKHYLIFTVVLVDTCHHCMYLHGGTTQWTLCPLILPIWFWGRSSSCQSRVASAYTCKTISSSHSTSLCPTPDFLIWKHPKDTPELLEVSIG